MVRTLPPNVVIFDPTQTTFGESLGTNFSKRCSDVRYAFDRVFDENATQEDVYTASAKQLINPLLDGYNCCVFAYGATGLILCFLNYFFYFYRLLY